MLKKSFFWIIFFFQFVISISPALAHGPTRRRLDLGESEVGGSGWRGPVLMAAPPTVDPIDPVLVPPVIVSPTDYEALLPSSRRLEAHEITTSQWNALSLLWECSNYHIFLRPILLEVAQNPGEFQRQALTLLWHSHDGFEAQNRATLRLMLLKFAQNTANPQRWDAIKSLWNSEGDFQDRNRHALFGTLREFVLRDDNPLYQWEAVTMLWNTNGGRQTEQRAFLRPVLLDIAQNRRNIQAVQDLLRLSETQEDQNLMGLLQKMDASEISSWWQHTADQGDPAAQCNLGVMYAYGRGIEQDDNQAVFWWQKAAEQEYAGARFHLGVMYATRRGGIISEESKINCWLHEAAQQGVAEAQYMLGVMYEEGKGRSPSEESQAIFWYKKSAIQGHEAAQCKLGIMYAEGRGDTLSNEPHLNLWLQRAAENSHKTAQRMVTLLKLSRGRVRKVECNIL